MPRRMVRARREEVFQSRNPTGLGGTGAKIRCNLRWARRYVPGSAESSVTLPPGCEQSCLERPTGYSTWVARLRHQKLSEMGKRPTRSKTFTNEATERQSFQTVVSCLWERYGLVRTECDEGGVSCPRWVKDALAECAECQAGSACTVMADLAAGCETAAATEGEAEGFPSVDSELSGEGTSASDSSVPDSSSKEPSVSLKKREQPETSSKRTRRRR